MDVENVLKETIKKLIEFPKALICKHLAALEICQAMQTLGYIDPVLVKAIVDCDDAKILLLLGKD